MKRLTCGQGCESAINWREPAHSLPATARGDIIISLTKETAIERVFFFLSLNIFQVDFLCRIQGPCGSKDF